MARREASIWRRGNAAHPAHPQLSYQSHIPLHTELRPQYQRLANMAEDSWYQSISDFEDGSEIQQSLMPSAKDQGFVYQNIPSPVPKYESSYFEVDNDEHMENSIASMWPDNASNSVTSAATSYLGDGGGSAWSINNVNDRRATEAANADGLPNICANGSAPAAPFGSDMHSGSQTNQCTPNFLSDWACSYEHHTSLNPFNEMPRGLSNPSLPVNHAVHPHDQAFTTPFPSLLVSKPQEYHNSVDDFLVSPRELRCAPSPSTYPSDSASEASTSSPFDGNEYQQPGLGLGLAPAVPPPMPFVPASIPFNGTYENSNMAQRRQLPRGAPPNRRVLLARHGNAGRAPSPDSTYVGESEVNPTYTSDEEEDSSDEDMDVFTYEGDFPDDFSLPARQVNSMGRTRQTPVALRDRAAKDRYLIAARRAGMTYKDLKARGRFSEAESTLRGRYRTLTKRKEERVRRPEWTRKDIALLIEGVNHYRRRDPNLPKIPWKQVAEFIKHEGGTYHFGNATCRKKWDELIATGLAS